MNDAKDNKGFLKGFKGLFVAGEAIEEKKEEAPIVKEVPAKPINLSPLVGGTAADAELVTMLVDKLKQQSLPKFDFYKFLEILTSLKGTGVVMDEAQLFKTASATMKAMGSDKAYLEESAKHYFSILQAEKTKFEEVCNLEEDTTIKGQMETLSHLEQTLSEQQKAVLKLQQEIDEVKTQIANKNTEVQMAKSQLDIAKNKFTASYNHCVNDLTTGLEKIKVYL